MRAPFRGPIFKPPALLVRAPEKYGKANKAREELV